MKILPPYFPATLGVVINGPGEYLTRSGEVVTIEGIQPGLLFKCVGAYADGTRENWHPSGRLLPGRETQNDIVREAGPEPAIVAPLSIICPGQRFGLIDDGMGNLARVPAAAWAAAHYHAHN